LKLRIVSKFLYVSSFRYAAQDGHTFYLLTFSLIYLKY
jgi:hypothetical protein